MRKFLLENKPIATNISCKTPLSLLWGHLQGIHININQSKKAPIIGNTPYQLNNFNEGL